MQLFARSIFPTACVFLFAMVESAQDDIQDLRPGMSIWPDLVIVGLGDSGTRAVTSMMEGAGLVLSETRTEAADNVLTWPATGKYATSLLDAAEGVFSPDGYRRNATLWKHATDSLKLTTMATGLSIVAQNYELAPRKVFWGLKNPADYLLMPLYDEITSNYSKYLFVVRDPRDFQGFPPSLLQSAANTAHLQNSLMNFETFGPHMKASKNLTDYWGYWSDIMSSVLFHYEKDARLKIVRIEDLVVPDPAEQLTSYHVLDCLAAHAGLPRPPAESFRALQESHSHLDSYMGRHQRMTDEDRARQETSLWQRVQADEKVAGVMERLGYDLENYGMRRPGSASVCTSEFRRP